MKFTVMSGVSQGFGRSATVAAALAASIALLVGCSSADEDELDMDGAVKQITSELSSRFDIKAKDLTCPDQVTVKAGATFGCDGVERGGGRFSIEVQLIGNDGRFTFSKPQLKGG
jgi:hypothetical protein